MLFSLVLLACTDDVSDSGDTDLPQDTGTSNDADGDGVSADTDCDDADPEVGEGTVWYADVDGDGFGDPSAETIACEQPDDAVDNADDCDDSSSLAQPGDSAELCDGLDNDCNGEVDDSTDWATVPGTWPNLSTAVLNGLTHPVVCLQAGTHDPLRVPEDKDMTVISAAGSEATFISGEGTNNALVVDGSLVLEGVTLIEGYPAENSGGAGLLVDGGHLEGRDIVIDGIAGASGQTYGAALFFGGATFTMEDFEVRNVELSTTLNAYGLVLVYDSSGDFTNVTVRDNTVTGDNVWGGIFVWNGASVMTDVDLLNNTYTGNTVSGLGLMAQSNGVIDATRVRVLENRVVGTHGGGAFVASSYGELTVRNAIVAGQEAPFPPLVTNGGSAVLNVDNATVVGNASSLGGVGYFAGASTSVALLNNVIAANNSADEGSLWYGKDDGSYTRSTYYLFDNNVSGDDQVKAGTFAGGPWYGSGGVEGAPGFVDVGGDDATAWDLRLASDSPARNAGDPELLNLDGSVSDQGAFGGPDAWQ